MTMDPTKFAKLIALKKTGNLAVCEYLRVEWNNGANTAYYAVDAYSRITPFRRVKKYTNGAHIEAKILGKGFQQFEISGDIRTDQVPLKFEDADGAIKALFKLYGAARVELFRYYPQVDANQSIWWGQILAPQRQGKMTFAAMMKNGYRSKERMLPNSPRPAECRFVTTFGGRLDTLDKVATSGCPYDKHLGGSQGLYRTGTTPFIDCPGDRAACTARFGHDRYFGGTDINALPAQTGSSRDPLSQTTGNRTIRNKALPWIFGTKYYGGADIVLWAPEFDTKHPDQGFVRGLWHVGEGRMSSIADVEVMGVVVGYEHINIRLGDRGQPATSYPGTTQNFSGTALVFARRGPLNPASITQDQMTLRVLTLGDDGVAVYSNPTTFSRVWTNDVVWCLLEAYTNQKCGLQYEHARFNIAKWITASDACSNKITTMTLHKPDGETVTFAGRRATFDAVLEGRPADQQILDICRAGRVSPPFQEDGLYSIVAIKAFTSGELAAAPVLRDYGTDKNIVFTGPESVVFSQIPDDTLPNEITVTFEEASNFDIGRPIVGNDPDQQRRAAQIAGNQAINVVPKQLSAVGVRNLDQAAKFLYHNLYFGDFESGGTKNNASAPITVPFEWVHAISKYGPVKLDLRHAEIPINPTTGLPFVWFRVMSIKAVDSNNAQITVAAYNKEFYEALEVETSVTSGIYCTSNADCSFGQVCINGVCQDPPNGGGPGCDPSFTMTQDPVRGVLAVTVAVC